MKEIRKYEKYHNSNDVVINAGTLWSLLDTLISSVQQSTLDEAIATATNVIYPNIGKDYSHGSSIIQVLSALEALKNKV